MPRRMTAGFCPMSKLFRRQLATALPALFLFMAGCGVGQFNGVNASSSGALSISSSSNLVSSHGQVTFHATTSMGLPADVVWSVAGSENAASLGPGHIDANGVYTPPAALSQDNVQIRIAAHLKSDPTAEVSSLVTVTPGFVQSLLPENAALGPGGTVDVSAEIAEVNAGSVRWKLTTASGESDAGFLGNTTCLRGTEQYTTCKVTYTAPTGFTGKQTVYLSASVNGTATASPLRILLNSEGINSSPLSNQAAQSGPIALGSSGGNDNDYDTYQDQSGNPYIADCCGGTLGSLVEDSSHNQYILSNNHVLAESDQGKVGDAIDEPGLIDNGCMPVSHAGSAMRPVGTLKYIVPLSSSNNLQTNVDAALAAVTPGAVDPEGRILQLDAPNGSPNVSNVPLGSAAPMAGNGEALNASNLGSIELAKSGRTTGLTCSTVESVDLSVKVDYFKDCAETQPYSTKTFTNQIGIAGDRFSDSGDSGALVVDAGNAQPVGLFFAGGTDGNGNGLSVANPIGDVLRELGTQAGSSLSIVGTNTPHKVACIQYEKTPSTEPGQPVPDSAMKQAQTVAETTGQSLINREAGILGVATGKSLDEPGQAALIVYTDNTRGFVSVPPLVDGLRTQVIATDPASFVRNTQPQAPSPVTGIHLSASLLAGANAVVHEYAPKLLRDPAIFGVGITQSEDSPAEPALLVLVDLATAPQSTPATIGGLRVRYRKLNRFHVTQSKYAGASHASSCALKGLTPVRTRSFSEQPSLLWDESNQNKNPR
jgi:hypothetical protein